MVHCNADDAAAAASVHGDDDGGHDEFCCYYQTIGIFYTQLKQLLLSMKGNIVNERK